MSKIALSGDASGTGTFTIASPNSNSNFTLTLPTESGTVLTTGSTTGISASALSTGTIPKARMYAGAVLQVVNATYGTQVATTSTSFVTTGFSASITPSSSSSRILVFFTANGYITSSAYDVFTLYRGATNLGGVNWGFGSLYGNTGDRFGQVSGSFLDSPASASPVTYTIFFRVTTSTGYINLNTGELSTMTLMEIAP